MIIKDIPQSQAQRLLAALKELRPSIEAAIVVEDPALLKLGLVQETPCTIEINATDEEINALVDEIDHMEIDAYNYIGTIKPCNRKALAQYERFAIIEAYLSNRE